MTILEISHDDDDHDHDDDCDDFLTDNFQIKNRLFLPTSYISLVIYIRYKTITTAEGAFCPVARGAQCAVGRCNVRVSGR